MYALQVSCISSFLLGTLGGAPLFKRPVRLPVEEVAELGNKALFNRVRRVCSCSGNCSTGIRNDSPASMTDKESEAVAAGVLPEKKTPEDIDRGIEGVWSDCDLATTSEWKLMPLEGE
jgi:hypothetical protein